MRYLVGFVLFLLALGTLRTVGCGIECSTDSDCDDANPCTRQWCQYYPDSPYSGWSFCGPEFHACSYMRLDNGTSCEVDGQIGVCESGKCLLEGEASDGGV